MNESGPKFEASMKTCDDTNDYFNQMNDASTAFFKQDKWDDILKNNYDANKDFVDQQWQFCLDSWNTGVYFNAGMFQERVWLTLSGIAPIAP